VIAALGVGSVIAVPGSGQRQTPVPTGIAVPSLAGQPLDIAEQRLDALGLRSTEEGGGIFGILVPSDWNVCQTSPGPGTRVRRGTTVSLLIDRPGVC
jgi:beta-lactam-binding protein with PASTA domain